MSDDTRQTTISREIQRLENMYHFADVDAKASEATAGEFVAQARIHRDRANQIGDELTAARSAMARSEAAIRA